MLEWNDRRAGAGITRGRLKAKLDLLVVCRPSNARLAAIMVDCRMLGDSFVWTRTGSGKREVTCVAHTCRHYVGRFKSPGCGKVDSNSSIS
jgi:hypothetical protein